MRYDFNAKQDYREYLWNAIDRMISKPRNKMVAAILDTGQGLETRELLRRGYKPSNIHVCNFSPAQVAVLSRRLHEDNIYDVQVRGTDFATMIDEMCRQGTTPDIINFDGCANLGWGDDQDSGDSWEFYLHNIADELSPHGVIAYTYLVGREKSEIVKAAVQQAKHIRMHIRDKEVPGNYLARLDLALRAIMGNISMPWVCDRHISGLECGWYMSTSGQVMGWLVARIYAHTPSTLKKHFMKVDKAFPLEDEKTRAAMAGLMCPPCLRFRKK